MTKGGIIVASAADKAQLSAAVYGDYKAPANWAPCYLPGIDFDIPESIKAWVEASAAYERQASGEIRAVIGKTPRERKKCL